MNDFSNSSPIATPEQYRAAILSVRQRMTAVQLAILQAHCRAAEHSISSNRLVDLLQLSTTAAVTTPYRNYARWLAEELKFIPTNAKNKHAWWLALAYGHDDGDIDGDYEWVMRPELVETLQAMRWA